MEEAWGYVGVAAEKLREAGARPGDVVVIERPGAPPVRGVLMPRYEIEERPILVVKLGNGYNIGVRVTPETRIRVERRGGGGGKPGVPAPLAEPPERLPRERVVIIGTGGTIASRIDYETGAVNPYMDADEIVQAVPEVLNYARIEAVELFRLFSEDMTPSHWERIASEAARLIGEGYDGVVIAHGTDTMHYTAAALSFVFHSGLPVPIVLTGAQRSSDRPSSDAAFNLAASVLTAARAPFAEVVIVMHGETGDTYALAHRGTRARKMHTSRRDAFQSINAVPLAMVWPDRGEIVVLDGNYRRRGAQDLVVENGFDDRVALVKYYPGMDPEVIDFLVDRGYHGIVLEGTGFGHVANRLIPSIQRAVEEGVAVVAASQTLFGRVNLNVYSTGRRMLKAGVIPAEDMTPETAYVKLSWVLKRTRDPGEVRRLMLTPLAGEISSRHSLRLYPRWYHGPA
ncbi:MAG: Glu-tRNA(Gln) amidotransferase subunit GatD [Desulfurococcales archaeon]|nr:Glu-tRNA(Gln) amidotransferase subunit GatD [Desulfurococcales archaeon]